MRRLCWLCTCQLHAKLHAITVALFHAFCESSTIAVCYILVGCPITSPLAEGRSSYFDDRNRNETHVSCSPIHFPGARDKQVTTQSEYVSYGRASRVLL